MRTMLPVLLVALAAPVAAQVQMRPTDPPIVTADRDAWFVRGDPLQYAGTLYYKAGPAVFFDGNRMVRTGDFNGVPLYADTTLEPFSVVFVPIGRNLMQPYERLRAGDLAGTTGSRAPSFPVAAIPAGRVQPVAPSPPTNLALPVAMIDTSPAAAAPPPAVAAVPQPPPPPPLTASALAAVAAAPAPTAAPFVPLSARPPDSAPVREHVWIEYQGGTWVNAGPAIPLEGSGLMQTGEYAGFAVFTRGECPRDGRVYLPALPGFVTPYRLKP